MEPLSVEAMSASELQSLALGQLADALSETMVGLSAVSREAITARVDLAHIRMAWSRSDGTYATRGEYDATLEGAKALCDALALRSRSLRELKSALQTLCRAVN